MLFDSIIRSTAAFGSIDDLFKCRPSLLYPIFVNQWSGTVNDDKLLVGSVNTCVAVRPFSMYGRTATQVLTLPISNLSSFTVPDH